MRGNIMKRYAKNILFLFLFFSQLNAFDNGGNPGDSNGNCPGESINLPLSGPSPFRGEGNVHGDAGDWSDRFYFVVPLSGTVKITLNSTAHTDLDFKMSSQSCNNQDLIRYTDDHTDIKTFSFQASANHTYYISIFDNEWRNRSNPYILTIEYPTQGGTPPKMNSVPDLTVESGDNIYRDFSSYVTKTEGDDIIEYQLGGSLPSGLSFNSNTGVLSGSSSNAGDYSLTIRAKDKDGWSNTQSWTLHITEPPRNVPPVMNDVPNQSLKLGKSIELDLSDYVTRTDGDPIIKYHLSGTLPDSLSFDANSGKITGTANNSSQVGEDFSLTVWATDKDGDSNKKSFSIHIAPKGTDVTQGDLPFYIANSLESRNIRGNYLILGNTIECHTQQKNRSLFEANRYCEDWYYGNNGHITNYIDIDDDSNTWNSSSSNFTLPPNSKIVWAGLFWQANLNNRSEKHSGPWWQIQRHAVPYNKNDIHAGWRWVQNSGETFSIEDTVANKILLKIDRETSYEQVTADTLAVKNTYYGGSHIGGPYAAFADITAILQKRNITSGKHTITVANLMATQGMDGNWLGDYGGWSIAIVYQNKNESIKNISIFNGFTIVRNPYNDQPPKYITISGFKLPKHHRVEGYLSVFSAEGEYNNHGDTMELEGHLMPGITEENQYNVFDEISHGLDRDATPWYNNLKYADTIDVDRYDVSDIMTELRDSNPNINKVTIKVATHQGPSGEYDAFFPSMFAFSAELYVPKVCYDYDIKIGNYYDIPSEEREFQASKLGDEPLKIKVMLQSEESDFDLIDTKMKLKFNPSNVFSYIPNASQTTYPNTYSYHQAIDTDPDSGEIAIGANATKNGGTIAPHDFLYSKLYYNFNKADFNGKFDIYLDAKVSFDGKHKIPYTLSTEEPEGSIFNIKRCSVNPTYDPVYGMFNIERGDSDFGQTEADRYSLYTQVVGVPYKVSIAAYKKDSDGKYKTPVETKATVELELIDASSFENNSSTNYDSICRDPDSYNLGKFVTFHNNSREYVNIPWDFPKINGKTTYPENLALRNAAFRVWVLTKKIDGENVVVNHNCKSQFDSKCFDTLYKQNYDNSGKCSNECSNSSGTSCYECLRKFFALPICSRDNFAIRPESYHIALSDDNETLSKKRMTISENSSNGVADLAAGYMYRLDINATKFSDKIDYVRGYFLNVLGDQTDKKAEALFSDSANCTDRANYNLNIYMLYGQSVGHEPLNKNRSVPLNALYIENSGKYRVHIEDSEWTIVDQEGYRYKPFRDHADCNKNSAEIDSSSRIAKRGCKIQSNLSSSNYYDLNINMHPYSFDLNTIIDSSNPNSASNYVYINDLSKTQSLIKNNREMAIKVTGQVVALGKNKKELSNYINGCSAYDVTLTLDLSKTPSDITDSYGNNLTLNYALYDSNAGDNSVNVKSISDSASINLNLKRKYFYIPSRGNLNSYFNFKREYNNPINPFKLHFGKIEAKSLNEKMSVAMQKNYIPSGSKNINDSKTLYYAKIKSESDFYDDIYSDNVVTPLYVAIYCNKSLNYCSKYGIDTTKALTSEYDWWLSLNHNGNSDGKAILQSDPDDKASINPTSIDNFVNGVANDIKVVSNDRINLPYMIYIKPDTQMLDNYPWLLYNKFNDTPPDYIFKVRFVNSPAAWSGQGKTGHTIDVKNTGRRTKKVDW